jgi:hypothetical protein
VYHWNLPSNPVDLEQREGRVHRYKGHAIRRNLAAAHSLGALRGRVANLQDPWPILFSLAAQEREPGANDLVPYWIYEPNGGRKVERHILAYPLSRESERIPQLLASLAAYRMVFGQPRQQDLLRYLQEQACEDVDLQRLLQYRVDLSPP